MSKRERDDEMETDADPILKRMRLEPTGTEQDLQGLVQTVRPQFILS